MASLSKDLLSSGYTPRSKTAPLFDIQIKGNAKRAYARLLKNLQEDGIDQILSLSAWNLANTYAGMLRSAYQNSSYQRSPMTIAVYEFGYKPGPGAKSKGKRIWMGTKPYNRSGILSRAIVVKKGLKQGRYNTYVVRWVDATYGQLGGGDPHDARKKVAWVAAQLEDPAPVVIQVTPAMLTYLHMAGVDIRGEKTTAHSTRISKGALKKAKIQKSSVIAYVPSKKPVMSRLERRIGRLYPRWRSFVKKQFARYATYHLNGGRGMPKLVFSAKGKAEVTGRK